MFSSATEDTAVAHPYLFVSAGSTMGSTVTMGEFLED